MRDKLKKQQHTPRPRLVARTNLTVKVYPTVMNKSAAHAMVLGHLRAAQTALSRLECLIGDLPDPLDHILPDDNERECRNRAELGIPQALAEASEHVMRLCQHMGDWIGANAQD
jgi:hypothetical protein